MNKKSNRPVARASISNVIVDMLVDTGAEISLLSEEIFRRIPIELRPHKLATDIEYFSTANGSRLNCRGKYQMEINLPGKKCSHEIYVVNNLKTPGILGADFINDKGLIYDGSTRSIYFKAKRSLGAWHRGTAHNINETTIPARSAQVVKVIAQVEQYYRPEAGETALAVTNQFTHITGGPGVIKFDHEGRSLVEIINVSDSELIIPPNTEIATLEKIDEAEMETLKQINPDFICEVIHNIVAPEIALKKEDEEFIKSNMNLTVPKQFEDQYVKLLCQYHDVFSRNKADLGRSDALSHDIWLKTKEPVYVKQFKI